MEHSGRMEWLEFRKMAGIRFRGTKNGQCGLKDRVEAPIEKSSVIPCTKVISNDVRPRSLS